MIPGPGIGRDSCSSLGGPGERVARWGRPRDSEGSGARAIRRGFLLAMSEVPHPLELGERARRVGGAAVLLLATLAGRQVAESGLGRREVLRLGVRDVPGARS